MVALPKTILGNIRTMKYPSKNFTVQEFKKEFAKNGYGAPKTVKWLEYFLENEIIKENSDGTLTCTMW